MNVALNLVARAMELNRYILFITITRSLAATGTL